MWYAKDQYTNKIYFSNRDPILVAKWCNNYNNRKHLQTQSTIIISDILHIFGISESKIDINNFTQQNKYYGKKDYRHPLAVKNYHNKHLDYIKNKTELVNKLCKKHHLWPRNESNRKLDSFDV